MQNLSLKPDSLSVIIPSWDGHREGNVSRLLEDISTQSIKNVEVHLIKGVKPSGLARNQGAKKARGEILVFLDDDIRLGHEKVFYNLIKPLREGNSIGMTGASIRIPENVNRFQKRCAQEIPRLHFPIVSEIKESDMATTACCAIRRDLFEEIGGFNEKIPRGVDPEFRARFRKRGYKLVLVPNTWFYHPAPKDMRELAQISFRNGWSSAWVQRSYPEMVYETPSSGSHEFEEKTTFLNRIVRNILIICKALFTGRFLLFWERICYFRGYLYGLLAK